MCNTTMSEFELQLVVFNWHSQTSVGLFLTMLSLEGFHQSCRAAVSINELTFIRRNPTNCFFGRFLGMNEL